MSASPRRQSPARRLKVLQVLPALESGGVERGTLEVARALVKAGHESVVLSAGGSMVAQLAREGSRHVTMDLGRKSLFTFLKFPAVRRFLAREDFDIVHVRSRLPAWVVWLAWRGMDPVERPRLVTTVHGMYSVNRYSAIMCRGERVVAVSETVRDYVRQNYPQVDPSRVVLIHRGVDPAEFPPGHVPSSQWLADWEQQFPQTRGKVLLTLPGRLSRRKGHHEFIGMVGRLRAAGRPVHGLIVGGEDPKKPAYARELRAEVARRSLGEDITFTGARRDMRDIYAVSRAVLSLSTKPEAFGRTVAEALSVGTPVIGIDRGGVGEILHRVYPAGAVPPGDFEALVGAAERLVDTPEHASLGDYFRLDAMTSRTLAMYEELAS